MNINQAGLNLVKSFEGCKLQAYQDVVGVWTCGWGATGNGVGPGVVWTQDEADARLLSDLSHFETGVTNMVTSSVSSNQFSAMVCFAYNCGLGNLQTSTLLKLVNASDFVDVPAQFLRWDKAGGNVVAGLTRRRQAESDLFSKPDDTEQLPAGPTDTDINSQLSDVE